MKASMRCAFLTVITTIALAAAQFSVPPGATAQRIAETTPFATAQSLSAGWDVNGDRAQPTGYLGGSTMVERPSVRLVAPHFERAVPKRRLLPYYLAGAIAGGAITYAVMPKSCDVGDNMFCQYTVLAYPAIGAGAGGAIGLLVGYFRER